MQLDLLPLQDRLQIALELEDRLSVFNEEQCNISRIHHIINRLKQPEDKSLAGIAKQTDLIRALVNRTVTYDRIRKQDVTKIHPKLSEVFKKWKTL